MSASLVQYSTYTEAEPGTSVAVTLSGVTAGNFLVVCTATDTDIVSLSSLTDSNGTPQTALAYAPQVAGNTPSAGIYFVPAAAAGTHTFTATFSASVDCGIFAAEFSGGATGLDVVSPLANASSGTAVTSASITPTQNGDLLFGVMAAHDAPSSITWNAGSLTNISGGGFQPYATFGWLAQSTAAAIAASGTLSSSDPWGAAIAAFKVDGAPTNPPGQFFFADAKIPGAALAMFMPLSWAIGRRNRRAQERQAERRVILPGNREVP
ncbi:MAG: hypothetical protein ACP5P4_05105 [Steroidobacteraceae bacterium]